MRFLKWFGHFAIVLFLTGLTQVGGLLWLLAVVLSFKRKKKKRFVFRAVYLLFNLVIIPPVASYFGREKLPWLDDKLKPRNWFYPLAFRNYVNPELKNTLESSSEKLSKSDIGITYLDANFPFLNGFPLLPHLSHNDGKKIDLSFLYLDQQGEPTDKKPSISGYGAFVNSDKNYTNNTCLTKGYWQYDITKYITFGTYNNLQLDKKKTAILIKQLLSTKSSQKLFIEPHLKTSLGLSDQPKIRFHGCQAVRHDDHIHFQIN
ncbi:MAG: hypothetical protein AB8B52_06825 [Winogradskyella sp.]|uniref:hypothetical protein n=1 Tax=Winogradskyella sp. TaxID=1883156 RepID=UPI00385FBFA4